MVDGQGEGLGDDGEVDPLDATAEGKEAEDQRRHARHQQAQDQGDGKAVKRTPEEWQFLHLVPHHEVGKHTAVDALCPRLQQHVHADGIAAQAEEKRLAQ